MNKNMTLKELYAVYGELLINVEIARAKINEIREKIANEINPLRETEKVEKIMDEETNF